MSFNVSPKYQVLIAQKINEALFNQLSKYSNVEAYLSKWQETECDVSSCQVWQKFVIEHKTDGNIDALKTLHGIDGDTLLKIAIDLGVETPDFIPSIPFFKNELKSDFETASQTFEKAFHNVEEDPGLAIGLANSALESIIKEILRDSRIKIEFNKNETLSKLIVKICKAFDLTTNEKSPVEIKTLASSLISACKAIEDIRSDKTDVHGHLSDDVTITNPTYAYFVVNAITSVGLFLLKEYKLIIDTISSSSNADDDGLPF